jgi:uncharacterized membrane protein YcaP (DUF421 family)
MDEINHALEWLFGSSGSSIHINAPQMALRAIVVYCATVLIVRLGKKRFMSRATAFDVILGIMLGSMVSRAIAGTAPFLPTLAASATLLAVHWLFSAGAVRSHRLGDVIKGTSRILVKGGRVDTAALHAAHMTDRDLWEELRSKSIADLNEVAEARLERSGRLSVIKARNEPRVIEIAVVEGVQTVRVELQ